MSGKKSCHGKVSQSCSLLVEYLRWYGYLVSTTYTHNDFILRNRNEAIVNLIVLHVLWVPHIVREMSGNLRVSGEWSPCNMTKNSSFLGNTCFVNTSCFLFSGENPRRVIRLIVVIVTDWFLWWICQQLSRLSWNCISRKLWLLFYCIKGTVSEMCLMCEMEQHVRLCFENSGSIVMPQSILQMLNGMFVCVAEFYVHPLLLLGYSSL